MSDFRQAAIGVEREKEFGELKNAIGRVLAPERAERFLKQVQERIRDFDAILSNGTIDRVDESLAKSGTTAKRLYEALTVSDQAQMREFYLSRIEEIDPALRARFQKLYSYY